MDFDDNYDKFIYITIYAVFYLILINPIWIYSLSWRNKEVVRDVWLIVEYGCLIVEAIWGTILPDCYWIWYHCVVHSVFVLNRTNTVAKCTLHTSNYSQTLLAKNWGVLKSQNSWDKQTVELLLRISLHPAGYMGRTSIVK